MYVTRHSEIVDPVLIGRLWSLYSRSYVRTARETPTHEMLERPEFREQLASAVNRVWVVWDDSAPVAMALVSTDVRATRWLSEGYFAEKFPDKHREGRVHYVVWVTVDPGYVDGSAVALLARHALAAEARDGAFLVFDTPEINQRGDTGGAAELMIRLARLVGEAQLVPLSTQRYYAVDFSPVRPVADGDADTDSDGARVRTARS